MNSQLRADADAIIRRSIRKVLPDAAVKRALCNERFAGRVVLVAAGKAAWSMANAAHDCLGSRIERGVVITKYGHVQGAISDFTLLEAGHPVPDDHSFAAAQQAIDLVTGLLPGDTVLFLLSGGGSALFEKPLISPQELQNITGQLLSCGADITEINTIRKRLSAVKGGRFAALCAPAQVFCIALSDVLGDAPDVIAGGPVCADSSTCADALKIAEKYALTLSGEALALLRRETPKTAPNVKMQITGSVRELCLAAQEICRDLGYEPILLTDRLCCEAREAGRMLASVLATHQNDGKSLAFIAGGETVVTLTGSGKGGRNQELALAAASGLRGISNAAVFSVGSDGTDGPTDAAGGYVDGDTASALEAAGVDLELVLRRNDSYSALRQTDGLIFTGPTGTNVNDLSVALLR